MVLCAEFSIIFFFFYFSVEKDAFDVLTKFCEWRIDQLKNDRKGNTRPPKQSSNSKEGDEDEKRRLNFKVTYPKKGKTKVAGLKKAKNALDAAIAAPKMFPSYQSRFSPDTIKNSGMLAKTCHLPFLPKIFCDKPFN